MSKLSASWAALWLVSAGAASAQAPAPAAAASQPAKPQTEAQAAMERAQRLAANPMKVILQASKIRRRPNEEPEPVDPNILRRTASRTEPAVTAPAPRPAAPTATVVAAAATTPAPAPAPTVQAPPPPPELAVANKVLPSAPAGGSTVSAQVPALEAALPVESAPAMPKAVAPTALPIAPAVVQPTLVTMVDPEIPIRLMAEGNRIKEVFADLQLRPDGTVAEVKVLPPVPRGWQSYIVSALEKWRFEPLPAARSHRVQLVFEDR